MKSSLTTVSELALAGLFAWWGYHHGVWGLAPIPSALLALVLGPIVFTLTLLAIIGVVAGIGALIVRALD